MWDGIAAWWGSVELWLTQQGFPVQFALFMVVIAPLCVGMVVLVDRVADAVARRQRRRAARISVRRSS